jgi:hypothetical protein
MTTQYTWSGNSTFGIEGTNHHEDTLRIENNYKEMGTELAFELHLPTLCITYADLKFANAIGGLQRGYPGSTAYGQTHFNPPINILGNEEVEKFTWIRGSHNVVIGPDETVIYWYPKETLIVPRLRIEEKKTVTTTVTINTLPISLNKPLQIDVSQYADGRSVGGLSIVKAHPQWVEGTLAEIYDLWVRVVDGVTKEPIPEAMIKVYRWDEDTVTGPGKGTMILADKKYTDGTGVARFEQRPSGKLETVVLDLPGRRAVLRSVRPFPGQNVQFTLNAWKMREDKMRYTWKVGDTIWDLAALTSTTTEQIMKMNGISDISMMIPGLEIDLPCFAAIYQMEQGDTFQWLTSAFSYKSTEELALVNGLSSASLLDESREIALPGWHFLYARPGDSVDRLEKLFGCPSGWLRFVGRCFHPDPQLPFTPEVVALPMIDFVNSH